jgi:hypothetical protein
MSLVIVEETTGTMAKWFRSEPMEYISLIMNEDAAHDCLADLGKLGVIQFTDVRTSDAVEGTLGNYRWQ